MASRVNEFKIEQYAGGLEGPRHVRDTEPLAHLIRTKYNII